MGKLQKRKTAENDRIPRLEISPVSSFASFVCDLRFGFWNLPARALTILSLLLLPTSPVRAVTSADREQFADGLYARGLHDLALQEYLPLLTNQPPSAQLDVLLYRSAECQRQLGRKDEAAALYGRVVKEFPQSAFVHRAAFRRAELHATGGRYLEAVNYFRALVEAKPPADLLASALYWQGYCEAKVNLVNESAQSYRRVVTGFTNSPFFGYACLGLAEAEVRRGAAAGVLRPLYEQAARSAASPRVAAEGWFQLADLAYREKQFPASAAAYDQLFKLHPADERVPAARLPAAWAFLHTGRAGEALKMAHAALARTPVEMLPEWLYLKGNCERQLQQGEAARASYARLLREQPAHALATAAAYEQALVAFELKDHAAVVALSGGTITNEYAEDLLWMRAESQVALGQRAEALAGYRQLVERFPRSPRVLPADFQRARLLREQNDLAAAAALYRDVAQRAGTNALAGDALVQAALARGALRQVAEAWQDWDALIRRFPAHAQLDRALYEKAQAEIGLGRDADAQATAERLVKEFPDRPTSGPGHYLLGILLERANKADAAEYHYQVAQKKEGKTALADQIQFRRAAVLQRQGRNDEAAALLQGLLGTAALTNMQPQLLEWLARFNLQGGKFKEAEVAGLALAVAAQDASWKQMAWYMVGRGRQGQGQPDAAREAYQEALKQPARTREGVESALYLGRVGLETKNFAAASDLFARAAEMAAGDDVLDIRAQSYFGMGQAARAQEKWDDASRYFLGVGVLFDDPKLTPEAMYYAAEALGKLNRIADRDKTLQELKQRYPDSAWAKK